MPAQKKPRPDRGMKTRRCTITFTQRTYELLAFHAARRHESRSELVERIAAAWLKAQADPAASQAAA